MTMSSLPMKFRQNNECIYWYIVVECTCTNPGFLSAGTHYTKSELVELR